MNRRQFLRNCALIAAGAVAADQLDLLEKVKASTRYFLPPVRSSGRMVTEFRSFTLTKVSLVHGGGLTLGVIEVEGRRPLTDGTSEGFSMTADMSHHNDWLRTLRAGQNVQIKREWLDLGTRHHQL